MYSGCEYNLMLSYCVVLSMHLCSHAANHSFLLKPPLHVLIHVCCGVNSVLLLDVCAQRQSVERDGRRSTTDGSHRKGEESGRADPKLYAADATDV